MAVQSPRGRRGAEPRQHAASLQVLPRRDAMGTVAPQPIKSRGLNAANLVAGTNGAATAAAQDVQEERCSCHGVPRGMLNGQHRLVANNGMDVYTGMFQNGQLWGAGEWQSKNNGGYQGGWKDGLFDGTGVFIFTSGECFQGNFLGGCPLSGVLKSTEGHAMQVSFSGSQGILEPDLYPTEFQHLRQDSENSINLFAPSSPKFKGVQGRGCSLQAPPLPAADGKCGVSVLPCNLLALLVRREEQAAAEPPVVSGCSLSQASTEPRAASHLSQAPASVCCSCHGIARSLLSGWHLVNEPNEGAIFEGDWQQGLRCGHGTWKSPAGSYEGEWDANRFCGEGTFWFADGDIFQGAFADGKPLRGALRKKSGAKLFVTFPGNLVLAPCSHHMSLRRKYIPTTTATTRMIYH